MNSNLLVLALLAAPLLGAAQVTDLTRDNGSNLNNGYAMAAADAAGVQGTPYLLPYWAPATLQLQRGGQPITAPLKYDLYRQELRVKRPQGDSVVVPLAHVKKFSLTAASPAQRFVCYPAASLPAEVHGGCAEVLYEGPHAQLLKFQRKELVKQTGESSSYASASTVSAFADQLAYYLRWPADGHLVPLRLKRASLEQALASQPAALAALKARKGSISTETDMATAVAAIDPLLTGK